MREEGMVVLKSEVWLDDKSSSVGESQCRIHTPKKLQELVIFFFQSSRFLNLHSLKPTSGVIFRCEPLVSGRNYNGKKMVRIMLRFVLSFFFICCSFGLVESGSMGPVFLDLESGSCFWLNTLDIYIYTYRERERDAHIYVYIYTDIYMYMYV